MPDPQEDSKFGALHFNVLVTQEAYYKALGTQRTPGFDNNYLQYARSQFAAAWHSLEVERVRVMAEEIAKATAPKESDGADDAGRDAGEAPAGFQTG